jgi:hypothetical protein
VTDVFERAVLFTGRGGSGTRLLSRLAVDAGVFIGNEVNASGDSTEWTELTYRMVVAVGGRRDLPHESRYRKEIRATAERVLGARRGRWGLKLPEMMLVLPMFVDAFPEAQVIHLTRHPVTASLRRTHLTSRLDNPIGAVALPTAYEFCGRTVDQIATDGPHLHNACAWNYQVTRVSHYARQQLPARQYCELKYESVCRCPDEALETVRSYLGVVGAGTTSIIVDPGRTGPSHRGDPRVQAIWDICGRTADLLGYRRDDEPVPVHP